MDVTRILDRIRDGEEQAAEELLPLIYNELRRMAAGKLSHEPPGQTLQATALVHEAYCRLVGSDETKWNSRAHFFGAAAEAMRRILVERARRKNRLRVALSDPIVVATQTLTSDEIREDRILDVDAALNSLAIRDARAADVVKLHFLAA